MNHLEDDKILSLILNDGKVDLGFKHLMSKYQNRVYHQIRRMVVEHDCANDILQNTFIKVFKNLSRFKGNSALYTWIYRIAANESLSYIKKNKKRLSTSLDSEHLSVKLKEDPYFDGDDATVALHKAIALLPPKQKLVFTMRYFEEMSYKDMSVVLETSEGALKASFHHAVKKLENTLRKDIIE